MNVKRLGLVVAIAALLLAISASTNASWFHDRGLVVNCDKGMNPQHILDSWMFSRPLELKLVGTCPGFSIKRDDVTVTAKYDEACPGATVDGSIEIIGADRVDLGCLMVTGSIEQPGVNVVGGLVTLDDMDISHNDATGLSITAGAHVTVNNSLVNFNDDGVLVDKAHAKFEQAIVNSNRGTGLTALSNSSVEFLISTASWNDGSGMGIRSGSSLNLVNSDVQSNGLTGVGLTEGATGSIADASITDNGRITTRRSGVFLRQNASVTISGSMLARNHTNVGANLHSSVVLEEGVVIAESRNAGLVLGQDSGARVRDGAEIWASGSSGLAIVCNDIESSVEIYDGANVGPSDCSDFDF